MSGNILDVKSLGFWIVSLKVPVASFMAKEAVVVDGVEKIGAYQLTRMPSGTLKQGPGHVYAHFFVEQGSTLGGEQVFECEISERSVKDRNDPNKPLMYYTLSLHPTDEKPTHRLVVAGELPKFAKEAKETRFFLGKDGQGDTNRAKIALVTIAAYDAVMAEKFNAEQEKHERRGEIKVASAQPSPATPSDNPLNEEHQRIIEDRAKIDVDALFEKSPQPQFNNGIRFPTQDRGGNGYSSKHNRRR